MSGFVKAVFNSETQLYDIHVDSVVMKRDVQHKDLEYWKRQSFLTFERLMKQHSSPENAASNRDGAAEG